MDAAHAQPPNYRHGSSQALWPEQPVQLARGRQPRDALAKTIPYSVASMDNFETSLRDYLNNPPDLPEHTEAQLSFYIGASFMVAASTLNTTNASSHTQPQQTSSLPEPPSQPHHQHQQPQHQHQQQQQQQPNNHHQQQHQSQSQSQSQSQNQQRQQHPKPPPGYLPANGLSTQYTGSSQPFHSVSNPATDLTLPDFAQPTESTETTIVNGDKTDTRVSLSIVEALQPTSDPKEKMRKQRAIAKCCVDSIQRIDGYRYSFHNCWNSKEDDSFRFSYYCNDSLLNKDRAANGKGAKLGKRATKPVYDCKGVLSIKFSATKQTLDVFYKHIPLHKTYEERAPPPRKDSKRRKFLEEHDPEALTRIASRSRDATVVSEERDVTPKAKKKRAKPDPPKPSNTSLESDLRAQSLRSLLELIQVDPVAAPGPTTLPAPPQPPPFQAPPPQVFPEFPVPALAQPTPLQDQGMALWDMGDMA
ncbi:predicted protein [Plenodomus lingam JN3]|uniref:Predicted protein n=1 Tax=Leptosphaeria maculans (strain JN3 / isolate v23.1.3 / race Av1-4-5-6-7-8) TaxID=985895 RepID=E4ZTU1_LEPMJ|nr:predicted protein [Plenodomus lingam JN3]CBX94651.1 predicted protein [Plenodomus lingam JN3]